MIDPDTIKPNNGERGSDGRLFSSIKRSPEYHIPIDNAVYDVFILAAEDEYETPSRVGELFLEGVIF